MSKYIIDYTITGSYEVEADSREEAVEKFKWEFWIETDGNLEMDIEEE